MVGTGGASIDREVVARSSVEGPQRSGFRLSIGSRAGDASGGVTAEVRLVPAVAKSLRRVLSQDGVGVVDQQVEVDVDRAPAGLRAGQVLFETDGDELGDLVFHETNDGGEDCVVLDVPDVDEAAEPVRRDRQSLA